ncbi:hypothetical protein ABZV77_42305 [Streptomyces sp. NPDC004732]|uniref:hypothetical protein n=1 Tax=Streptomyces sp. NPDC004732 TaxID=3154290 RepID=UPI0033A46902
MPADRPPAARPVRDPVRVLSPVRSQAPPVPAGALSTAPPPGRAATTRPRAGAEPRTAGVVHAR